MTPVGGGGGTWGAFSRNSLLALLPHVKSSKNQPQLD